MCTASWLREAGSLHLFFNRDELVSREAGEPPAQRTTEGVRWIAPRDGRSGGTWIAATELGLALALLNRSEGVPPDSAQSRGNLIPRLAAAGSPATLRARLGEAGLDRLAPFRLLALWRDHDRGLVAGWDGSELDLVEVAAELGLLCSSGLGDDRATAVRAAVFEDHRTRARTRAAAWTPAEHRLFHRAHAPARSSWSPCMHRHDAETVSYAEIALDASAARLDYHAASPCRPGGDHALRLAQRPAPGAD